MEIKKPLFPAVVIVLAAAALLAGGRLLYLFFYLLLLLFLIPCLQLQLGLRRLSGDIEVSSTYCEVGQTLTVLYRISNSPAGRFPYLELAGMAGESFGKADEVMVVALDAGERSIYRREVKCNRRGRYDLEGFLVKTGDPFGVFKIVKPLATGKVIRIYPQLKIYSDPALAARLHFGEVAVRDSACENFSEIADLREWRQGDSVKRIHWKHSARRDELVIKDHPPGADTSFHIFVDMGRESYRHDCDHLLEDLAVEYAAWLIHFALGKGMRVRVFCELLPSGGLCGRQPADYREIMDELITLSPAGKSSFEEYVHGQSYCLASEDTLDLITPRLDLSGASMILHLKQRGFSPVLTYLSFSRAAEENNAALRRLKEAGAEVRSLHPREEI